MYFNRTLESFFLKAATEFPVMLLTGARQVGKTTLLRHISEKDRSYVTLDDPLLRTLANDDPALFLQRYRPPVLIDEIQYAPGLLPYIKMEIDSHPTPGAFWLTGSQQFHIMKGITETLAGRVGIVSLLGFSMAETVQNTADSKPFLDKHLMFNRGNSQKKISGLSEIYECIWKGSMPGLIVSTNRNKDLFYSSYVDTYLKRDISQLTQVADELAFLRFLRAAAARTGQLLNVAELARDVGVAPNTANHWISLLSSTGIIYLLEPFHSNITKRLIKSPKLHFLDTGLCSWLTQWTSPKTLEAGAFSGAIFESWVVSELIKSYSHHGRRPPFFFYRDKDKKEIDLLIYQDGVLHPIEIKKTASPSKRDIVQFKTLARAGIPVGEGYLICLCKDDTPLTETTTALPVGSM